MLNLTLEAALNVNPDQRGRPSPVALKLFELKSVAGFDKADFFALFDKERETLGQELVAREEFLLKPGDRIVQSRKLAPETQYVGFIAGFRDLERAQWRLAVSADTVGKGPVNLQLESTRIGLKGR